MVSTVVRGVVSSTEKAARLALFLDELIRTVIGGPATERRGVEDMDLALDDEQMAVADLARTLAVDVLAPAARAAERAGAVPRSVWATLFESGLTVSVPESAGGGGVLSDLSRQVAVQNLAFGDPGIAMAAVWSGAVAGLIAEHGSGQQRELLPVLASDTSRRSGVALYEGFGRSPQDLATTIAIEGDVVRVVGTKVAVRSDGQPTR
jgi:alkylation response protein AidB-like acyl-CoA dehydrogenase